MGIYKRQADRLCALLGKGYSFRDAVKIVAGKGLLQHRRSKARNGRRRA